MLIDRTDFEQLETDVISSPIGDVLIVVSDGVLLAVDFGDYEARMMKLLSRRFKTVELHTVKNPGGMCDRLQQYFSGDLTALQNIPMATGGTPFQQQVWSELQNIEPGNLLTYGELARNINNPAAVRAVGMANSLNPISIALPCHRVIGANGKLTGYAGGVERKGWLLAHEGVSLPASGGVSLPASGGVSLPASGGVSLPASGGVSLPAASSASQLSMFN